VSRHARLIVLYATDRPDKMRMCPDRLFEPKWDGFRK
jgi:hypothetical protein